MGRFGSIFADQNLNMKAKNLDYVLNFLNSINMNAQISEFCHPSLRLVWKYKFSRLPSGELVYHFVKAFQRLEKKGGFQTRSLELENPLGDVGYTVELARVSLDFLSL